MNALRSPVQHRTAGLFFGLTVVLGAGGARADGGASSSSPSPPSAPAPSSATAQGQASAPELVAAREIFRQATEDVDAGRYAAALEKFRRVAAVKETANVRFNIARCEESLGKTGGALADFELAEREGKGEDVASLAHDRAAAIRPRVPRLGVTAPTPPPEGLSVTLDGSKLAIAALGVPLPVDPGPHAIDATAPGRDPFHWDVTLRDSESKTIAIPMAPGSGTGLGQDTAASSSSSRTTWGIVTLAASGALAVGSVAFLLLHNGAVSSVEDACPHNQCQPSSQASVSSDESSARTDETLSVIFAATAVVGAGVGLYLVLGAPSSAAPPPTAVLSPGAPGAPAGFSLTGRF